jgi:transposase
MQATTIGLDIAKSVFQGHGVDARGRVVLRKRLARAKVREFFANLPRCGIGLEACGGAHYWARELIRLGHDARLMPPQYVKARRSAPTSVVGAGSQARVKTNKHDAADAEACCEAVQRPSMRFVAVKSEAQQATLMLRAAPRRPPRSALGARRGVRDQLIGQRTATINALRARRSGPTTEVGPGSQARLAELGIVAAQRQAGLQQLLETLAELEDARIPPLARQMLQTLVGHLRELAAKVAELDRRLVAMTRTDPICRSLAEVPGSPGTQDRPRWSVRSGEGPVIATAFAATVPDARAFGSGRHLAAWLGLVPGQHRTGGQERLLGISKRGDGYLRRPPRSGPTTGGRPWEPGEDPRRPSAGQDQPGPHGQALVVDQRPAPTPAIQRRGRAPLRADHRGRRWEPGAGRQQAGPDPVGDAEPRRSLSGRLSHDDKEFPRAARAFST